MNLLREKIKRIIEQEVGSDEWIEKKLLQRKSMTSEEVDQLGKNVLELYKDKFTVEYFIERIPFLKDYTIIIQPGNSPYDDNTNGMQYRIEFGLKKIVNNKNINIGETYITTNKIFMFSEFIFSSRQNGDVVFYNFYIKNRIVFDPIKVEDEETDLKIKLFIHMVGLVAQKLSYNDEIMIIGDNGYFYNHSKNEYEFNDSTVFPEDKLDNIINQINKTLFEFEAFISHLDLKIEK